VPRFTRAYLALDRAKRIGYGSEKMIGKHTLFGRSAHKTGSGQRRSHEHTIIVAGLVIGVGLLYGYMAADQIGTKPPQFGGFLDDKIVDFARSCYISKSNA